MTEGSEQSRFVGRFLESLTNVVDLGFADDACDPVVTLMFEKLVHDSVRAKDVKRLPFRLPASRLESETTHAQLLKQVMQLQGFVERTTCAGGGDRGRDPILFPFITALGVAGGIFLLVVHIARFVPAVLERSGLLS